MINNRYDNYANYIRENTEYYLDKFSHMEVTGKQTSWNWAAFFFTDAWMLYRKMYKWFIIVFILQYLVGAFLPSLSIILHIAIGLFGNHLYKLHIDQISTQGALLPPDQQAEDRAKRGGTSSIAIAVYLIISFVFTIFSTIIGTLIS